MAGHEHERRNQASPAMKQTTKHRVMTVRKGPLKGGKTEDGGKNREEEGTIVHDKEKKA